MTQPGISKDSKQPRVFPVILAGGASSRLWPISDNLRPKWDLRLFGEQSMLEGAWERAKAVADISDCLVVAGQAHERLILNSLDGLDSNNLLIEPGLRDTAGAVAYAVGRVLQQDPDGILLVMPGDALISPMDRFAQCIALGVALGVQEKALVAFGIKPRFPATCYGYLQQGDDVKVTGHEASPLSAFQMPAFIEKPERPVAEQYLANGGYFWNAGIFAYPLDVLMSEFEKHLPGHAQMAKALGQTKTALQWKDVARTHYDELAKVSIDFGVMEKANKVAAVACDIEWDDIGSWSAVGGKLLRDGGNAVGDVGSLEALDAKDNVVIAPGRRVALIGVENLAVVDDSEGLLICALDNDQMVKKIAQRKPSIVKMEVQAPSQGRSIDVLLIQPESVGPETGFLLMIHGWGNSRYQYERVMVRWAERYNVVCIAPEYRDSGCDVDPDKKSGTRIPYDFSHLQLIDCLNAYQVARRRYTRADASRSYIWGGSQGGHIALLAAAFAPKTFAVAVACCPVVFPGDARRSHENSIDDEADARIRDFRCWADRVSCPVVLMHGVDDPTVPVQQTREAARALAEAGKDFSVRFIPGGDHFLKPTTTRDRVTEEMADQALKHARRQGKDDFESKSVYEFPGPDGQNFILDFSDGLAQINRMKVKS